MPPILPSSSAEKKPYVVSLTLQCGLRYVGLLSEIGNETREITLTHVICMGSESRESPFGYVPVYMEITETMAFSQNSLARVECFDTSAPIIQVSFASIGRRFNAESWTGHRRSCNWYYPMLAACGFSVGSEMVSQIKCNHPAYNLIFKWELTYTL